MGNHHENECRWGKSELLEAQSGQICVLKTLVFSHRGVFTVFWDLPKGSPPGSHISVLENLLLLIAAQGEKEPFWDISWHLILVNQSISCWVLSEPNLPGKGKYPTLGHSNHPVPHKWVKNKQNWKTLVKCTVQGISSLKD